MGDDSAQQMSPSTRPEKKKKILANICKIRTQKTSTVGTCSWHFQGCPSYAFHVRQHHPDTHSVVVVHKTISNEQNWM